jgi:hypothetical protein
MRAAAGQRSAARRRGPRAPVAASTAPSAAPEAARASRSRATCIAPTAHGSGGAVCAAQRSSAAARVVAGGGKPGRGAQRSRELRHRRSLRRRRVRTHCGAQLSVLRGTGGLRQRRN